MIFGWKKDPAWVRHYSELERTKDDKRRVAHQQMLMTQLEQERIEKALDEIRNPERKWWKA